VAQVITKNSPHQSDRMGSQGTRLIVVHTPEGRGNHVQYIAHPGRDCWKDERRVSYHRLIAKNGSWQVQFVPWKKKAWHAGDWNGLTEGVAVEGFARHFDLSDEGVVIAAQVVAERLVANKLKPQWTTDARKGGFCRHADIQSDRFDPTPDLKEWRLFGGMVKAEYKKLTDETPDKTPAWFWHWARWRTGGKKWRRPGSAPRLIPPWAWVRYAKLSKAMWMR
jgi:hypothetical protein